jgi:hypothetical protein
LERVIYLGLRLLEGDPKFRATQRLKRRAQTIRRLTLECAFEVRLSDCEAAARLRTAVRDDPEAAGDALRNWTRREHCIRERGRRLRAAALDDGPVAPASSDHQELFAEEEALGRIPLSEAYARLAEQEPRLRVVEDEVRAGQLSTAKRLYDPLNGPLGEESGERIFQSLLTRAIINKRLGLLAGTLEGDEALSFFDQPTPILDTADSAIP